MQMKFSERIKLCFEEAKAKRRAKITLRLDDFDQLNYLYTRFYFHFFFYYFFFSFHSFN